MAKEVPYLDVQNLTKSFGALLLFEDISFSIAEGQKVGLIAKNGVGKSTLLSILCGKEGYDSGTIIFRRDLKVGFLEQSPVFDPEESVLDACFNHQGDPERVLKAKQILTQLKIRDLQQPMGQLSGGQQKRVALANVLILEPDLIILDEPTNHLDLEMIEWLEGFLGRGNKTLLMVTHDRDEAYNMSSRIAVMDKGKLLGMKDTKELFADPGSTPAAILTGCKNIAAARKCGDHEVEIPSWGIRLQTAQEIRDEIRRETKAEDEKTTAALKQAGMEVFTVPAADVAKWQAATMSVRENFIKENGELGQKVVDECLKASK